MRVPKLKLCVGILQVLNKSGQVDANKIAVKVKIKRSLLEQCIRLLVEQGMVSEIEHSSLVIYDITKSGKKILKFFKLDKRFEINQISKISKL
jgi:predicted transcriptional regulator